MVLDECHRQISEATGKQQGKIDELNAEIRKLKAMIGKDFHVFAFQLEYCDVSEYVTDKSQNIAVVSDLPLWEVITLVILVVYMKHTYPVSQEQLV